MNRGAALTGALLTTLETPSTWPLALAVFFLRGGLLLVVLPIVVLPSPVGLGNVLAPTLMAVVFSGVSTELAIVIGLVALAIVAWFVIGGLAAARLEAEAARLVARDDELVEASRPLPIPHVATDAPERRTATRILAVRAIAHLPTVLALAWGAVRLVTIAYRELTSPFDVATPIVLRVVRGAPEAIAAIVLVWMAGEIVGALAARRIALGGAAVGTALREGVGTFVRRPLTVLADFWLPMAGLVLVLLPSTVAATGAWQFVRAALRSQADPFGATFSVLLFVTLWLVGLLLIAVAVAWRSAVWSVSYRAEVRPREGAAGMAGG